MANISNAKGTLNVSVKAGSEKEMRDFLACLAEYFRYGEYGAFFDPTSSIAVQKEKEGFSCSVDFTGFGRWSFMENIGGWFGSWSKTKEIEKYVKEIEKYDFRLMFDFVDFEEGCEIFYHAIVSISHNAGNPLDAACVTEDECEDISITAENLVAYDMYADDEVIDGESSAAEIRDFLLYGNDEYADVLTEDEARRIANEYGILYDECTLDYLLDEYGVVKCN